MAEKLKNCKEIPFLNLIQDLFMNKLQNILILAGGDGTRFWPLTKKSYFSFLGQPLLKRQINNLIKFSENLYIVVNSNDLDLINRINLKQKTRILEQNPALTGMAGAVLSAKDKINGNALILNAEDLIDLELLRDYLNLINKDSPEVIFTGRKVDNYFPGGYFRFAKERLVEIVEKPDPDKIPSNLIKLVVDYFSDIAKFIAVLEVTNSQNDDRYEQAVNNLLHQNVKARYLTYDDYWYPLKFPWHALPIMRHFLKTLDSEIKLGKNVSIAKTAKIVGPCFIDDNSVIGDFALVRESHIGKSCIIGGYSEVTRSYLGNNVYLHRNYVGDSILDNRVRLGAGAAIANLRFDEKSVKSRVGENKIDTNLPKFGAVIGANSKIGVNATLLPGIKIGRNTLIAPGYTIAEDMEDNKFIFKRKTIDNKF